MSSGLRSKADIARYSRYVPKVPIVKKKCPACVADALDRKVADRIVAVSSRLILVSGLGSVPGPIIGTSVMKHFAIDPAGACSRRKEPGFDISDTP
jgi:hypothetical protein